MYAITPHSDAPIAPIALSELGRIGNGLKNISSLAFGGADLRTAYLGCLLGDAITSFRAPVAGHSPVHWHYPVAR